MKKIILSILFISCFCPTALFSEISKNNSQTKPEDFLTEYRSYPFLWIYPEYYYKANIIPVRKEKISTKGLTKVEFFGLSAYVPSMYTDEITHKHDIMYFKSKTGTRIIMTKSPDSSYLCSEKARINQKDYCSAYKTPQELFDKTFTLTPDTADNTGDKWIVHGKGIVFNNVKKIEIYSDDKFMAYVKYIKDALVEETKFSSSITLFHINGPLNSHITITFPGKDDMILNHFISTIE